jgi:hypothetical protein
MAIPTWTFDLVSLKIYVKLLSSVKILNDEKNYENILILLGGRNCLGLGIDIDVENVLLELEERQPYFPK